MSYYAVDLFSSLPAGPAQGGAAAAPAEAAKPVTQPAAPEEKKAPPHETIRVLDKTKKQPVQVKPKQKQDPAKAKTSVPKDRDASEGNGAGGVGLGGGAGGAGIVAEAGPAFPYPWYLKAIADRLDKQWRPPQEFQTDTLCQVAFVIHKDGQMSDSLVEKASGDSFFDQLALRAVLYSSPLPPLPAGYPEDTLKVHMKFVGKRL